MLIGTGYFHSTGYMNKQSSSVIPHEHTMLITLQMLQEQDINIEVLLLSLLGKSHSAVMPMQGTPPT